MRKRHKAGARPHQRERPRPGPKAGPRRGRRPTDRLGIGAITLAAVVGLSLLGIAERALLDGGPFGGAPGPAGSHHSMKPPEPGADTPARPRRPPQRPPGGGGAGAPRAEIEFGLQDGTGAVPLDGAEIGGWTFRERARLLLGFAERGALQVLCGGLPANLGPVPAADGPSPPSPSPPKDGAGPSGAPPVAATEKRSPNGANSQQW